MQNRDERNNAALGIASASSILYDDVQTFLSAYTEQQDNEDKALLSHLLPRGENFERLAAAYALSEYEQAVLTLAIAQEISPVQTRMFLSTNLAIGVDFMSVNLTPYLCQICLPDDDPSTFVESGRLLGSGILRLGSSLTIDNSMRTLTVTPGILYFLQELDVIDPSLTRIAQRLDDKDALSPSQEKILEEAINHLHTDSQQKAVLFYGALIEDMKNVAVHLLERSGPVLHVDVSRMATRTPEDVQATILALGRETTLSGFQILLDLTGSPPEGQTLDGLAEQMISIVAGRVVIMSFEPISLETGRAILPIEVSSPTAAEQQEQWALSLDIPATDPAVQQLGDQFRLSLGRIQRLSEEVRSILPRNAGEKRRVVRAWQLAKLANRRAMGQLAQRVETRATWDDLILPEADRAVLEQITAHVRYRSRVYGELGMSRPGRGRAISALFSGPSGTGKTLSAEVLANELDLDLYRIDMSSTISKYIGETEKNLRKIFDAADQGGCILLFDEADSVFGKRGEVKDANDRYANVQVNYLLQRLETFNGLAILTTNMESSMDIAFMRRLQFVLNFRAPGVAERERLWRRAFPPTIDTSGLDFEALARAEVSGGNIRSIAVNAVLTALSRDEELSQEIVEEALHLEYRKLGRLVL